MTTVVPFNSWASEHLLIDRAGVERQEMWSQIGGMTCRKRPLM